MQIVKIEKRMISTNLKPADELSAHSKSVTDALIQLFMSEDHTCLAYFEVESYLSDTLFALADKRFFNSAVITIDSKATPNMRFCKLSTVEQGILKEILAMNLLKQGYNFENLSSSHGQISLRVSIS
ncbi:TPA: hypothetical protein NJ496_004670 [Vibrio parahaemolyticus]|nr:hypothetical protein [Vibrio parahaemolyticus]